MDNAFNLGKRVFAAAVASVTIFATMGFAAFVAPQTASAASMGDVITGTSLSASYFYGYDGSRYTFPNEKTYETWFDGFDDVVEIDDAELADIDLAGNVVYRPGSRWVKIDTDPKTYAVGRSGAIQWIETEDVAVDYAGDDWNQSIDDVPDVFFVDYSEGASLMSATAWDGAMYMDGGDYYLSWGGESRMVDSAGRTANNMEDRFFMDGAGIDATALTAGDVISAEVCDVVDASQTGCDTVVEASGDITASLSSSTAAGSSLPLGANSVEMISIDLTAGDATSVSSLTFAMNAIGATTNITNAYLYEGGTRLTEARSVNASTRTVAFNNLGLDFAAGQTRTVTVRIEVSTTAVASDEISFELESADDVVSTGTVGGSFPLSGNVFSVSGTTAGTLTIVKNGTMVNPTLGATDHTIGQFRITANNEAASLSELTLKIDNSADHSNFKLWDDSVELATGTYLGNKLVFFDLSASPFDISEGGNNIFKVTADVGGESAETIGVYVDNAVDVVAYGGDFGFGMTADIATAGTYDGATLCNAVADNCSFSTIQGGDVTVTFNGPSAGDIPRDSQDQVLMNLTITAENEVTVKDLDIIVGGEDDGAGDPFTPGDDSGDDDDGLINTGAEGNLKDIKIINTDTGSVIMGPLDLDCVTVVCGADGANDGTQTIDFTDDFSMSAGEVLNLSVTADIDNTVTSGTSFGATFDRSGFSVEDIRGDTVTNIVPATSDLNGYSQTAEAPTLTIQLGSASSSQTRVQGTSDVEFLDMVFTAGDSSDITVTSLTMTGYGDDTNATAMDFGGAAGFEVEEYLSSCSVYEDDVLVDGSKSVATTGAVVFDTIDWTVAAGASQSLTLECDVVNTADVDDDVIAFDIALDTDVTAQDADSNTPTITTTPAVAASQGINDTDGDATVATGNFDGSTAITITASGTLAVTAGSGTPRADLLTTGTTGNDVAIYTFAATNESFDINTLTFSEEQAEDDTGTADSNAYANNISKVNIAYPTEDGLGGTASASMAGNEAKFSSLDMYVEAGEEEDVDVSVDVAVSARDVGGSATSNEKVRLGFFVDAVNDDNFSAIGAASGVTLDDDNVAAVGDDSFATDTIATFPIREAVPTFSLHASSPSGSGFVPGDQEVLRFNVAASANEDVVLDELIFDLSSTDNIAVSIGWNEADTLTNADLDIYETADLGTALDVDGDWAFLNAAGTVTVAAEDVEFFTLNLTTPEIVAKGTTNTYSLYFDSTGANAASDDSIQVSIPTDPVVGTYLEAVPPADLLVSVALGDATVTVDAGEAAGMTSGDVICVDTDAAACDATNERMLVVSIAGDVLTVVRGYLGTNQLAVTAAGGNDGVTRLPSSLLWEDDGNVDVAADEFWGSYLVDGLPLTGNSMQF